MTCPITLYATADWRFVLDDIRDASGAPLDLTGYRLKIQFRHASQRNFLIAELDQDGGITVAPATGGHGPTVTLLSRAYDRTWRPLVDTPVVGDLMMFQGSSSTLVSEVVRRIGFVALWGSTSDDG